MESFDLPDTFDLPAENKESKTQREPHSSDMKRTSTSTTTTTTSGGRGGGGGGGGGSTAARGRGVGSRGGSAGRGNGRGGGRSAESVGRRKKKHPLERRLPQDYVVGDEWERMTGNIFQQVRVGRILSGWKMTEIRDFMAALHKRGRKYYDDNGRDIDKDKEFDPQPLIVTWVKDMLPHYSARTGLPAASVSSSSSSSAGVRRSGGEKKR